MSTESAPELPSNDAKGTATRGTVLERAVLIQVLPVENLGSYSRNYEMAMQGGPTRTSHVETWTAQVDCITPRLVILVKYLPICHSYSAKD